jgi:cyclase
MPDPTALGRVALRRRHFAVLALSAGAAAAAPPPSTTGPGEPLETTLLRTGLYLITGGGCNTLARLSASGVAVVDGKRAGTYRALKSQLRKLTKISDLPVRVLVLTDHRPAHAGTAADFVAAGVPILAQRNAERRLLDGRAPGIGPRAIVAYEHDYTVRLGGIEARVLHPGPAQTDDGAVVLFTDLRVIAVGDLFTAGTPQPDFAAGGSVLGWGAALGQVLGLDFDTVVPGDGPLATRADLVRFKSRMDDFAARALALVRQGVGKDDLMRRLAADGAGWRLELSGDGLERFYAELSRGA